MQCFRPTDTAPLTVTGKALLHQSTILGAVARMTKYDKDSPRWAQYMLTVSKYFAKNMSGHTIGRLVADMWSTANMVTYMSVAAHCVTEDWKLQAK